MNCDSESPAASPKSSVPAAKARSIARRVRQFLRSLEKEGNAVLCRRLGGVLLALGLLCLFVGAGLTFVPDLYRATARVVAEKAAGSGVPGDPTGAGPFDPYFIQTEFEKIQSKEVLYRVIEALGLDRRWARGHGSGRLSVPETYRMLRRNLEVRLVRGTCLIQITVSSRHSAEAAEIANGIASAYRESARKQARASRQRGLAALHERGREQTAEVRELQGRLDEARAELARLEASDTNAVGAAGLLKTNVASLQRDLEAAQRSRDAVLLWLVQEDVDSTIPKSWPVEIVDLAETPTRPVRSGVRSGASLMGIGLVFVLAGTFLRREDAGLPGGG